MVAQRGLTAIPKRSDIVLVSAGGRPQDVNLYQAQKALDNASQGVRDGGILIWVAECREGFGNATFESWLRGSPSPADLLDRFHQGFVLGAHKAAAIARVLSKARVYLVSALAADVVRSCGMLPFDDLEPALREAFAELGPNASVSVLPYGSSILLREEANMRTAL